ncbi:MAG: DNA protecting protein DprA [Candidatus Liptonbacteria bacterium RIFCSPLOWO2_01_FULL_52_25]|uniref:DNA protecting protein DprA n=1 Tax=Candidatus Liptonbacteria bacterium RIFCSPLOWO2_01_FULL_52_25 TaxID=1798650 RepID=A0A1G2CC65_9BACT|nr:MAG: DNA protecting protein DprA [Candidatus Liptonbacteria bacterium RIFCSPLOWO2_01_FULL_52_25]
MQEAHYYHSLNILLESDYRKLAKLKSRFATWQGAWDALSEKERKGRDPENDWRELERSGIRLIFQESHEYPSLLQEIHDPPFGLYALGTFPSSSDYILAIVGTRKATPEGKELAKRFAAACAKENFVIVSGLALGIDAAAHTGCLDAEGTTLAVLGNGLDSFYPNSNERLARRILEARGALISEYPPGSPPLPYHFLERNRIVAGLAKGVLVIEAPERSGSLVTARLALEENRDVFVIPGPVTHPNFKGSHELIRSGATLVTRPEDILEAFGIESEQKNTNEADLENDVEKIIFRALKAFSKPATVDKIIELTELSTSDANRALTFLTLKNIVKETVEGYTL